MYLPIKRLAVNHRFKAILAYCCLAIALSSHAMAASGYLVDSQQQVIRSSFGSCWHASDSDSVQARAECEAYPAPPSTTTQTAPIPESPAVAKASAAIAAPPQKASAAIAAPPQPLKIQFSAWFDFDKAQLRPETRFALTRFAALLRELEQAQPKLSREAELLKQAGYKPGHIKITIVGHSDRIGRRDYNQSLSTARAEAAKTFLINEGIDAKIIDAYGRGFVETTTTEAHCQHFLKHLQQLITCYQPDRRVDIRLERLDNR